MNEQTGRAALVVDTDALNEALEALGYESKQAKADYLNYSRPAFSKIIRGLADPSTDFIAAVLMKQNELTKGRSRATSLSPFFRAVVR